MNIGHKGTERPKCIARAGPRSRRIGENHLQTQTALVPDWNHTEHAICSTRSTEKGTYVFRDVNALSHLLAGVDQRPCVRPPGVAS